MKKNLFMGLALLAAFSLVGCKSSQSSYKKAYEKALAQEAQAQQQTPVTVTPVQVQQPVEQTPVDNSNLRKENLTVLNNGTLKAYNVVCGSFGNLNNAQNLRNTLVERGYSAQIAQNENGMYRVIATSFDDRASAVNSRNDLRRTYPDAWLLLRTY